MTPAHTSNRPQRRVALLLFCITAASILLGSLAQRYMGHVMEDPNLDFYDYYFAAKVVHEQPRANLYQGATDGNPQLRSAPADSPIANVARQEDISDTELYLYPPLFADLLTPLTHLSLQRAALLWRAFNLLAVLASALLIVRLLRLPLLSAECLMVLMLSVSFWPVHEAISLGQITPLLLALWTLGLVAYAGGMTVLSAVAFALATAFKVTPLLLVPLFLLWKEWRWLLSYGASLLIAAVLMLAWNGPANLLSYAHVVSGMGGVLPSLQNKCIGSVAAWMYYRHVFNLVSVHTIMSTAPHGLLFAIKLLDLLFYAMCLILVARRRQNTFSSDRVRTLAVFALVTLVIAPVSWRHGYTVAIIPFALLWNETLRTRRNDTGVWLLAVASVAVGSLIFDLAAGGPLPQVLKIFCASVWPVACALLCFTTLVDRHTLAAVSPAVEW